VRNSCIDHLQELLLYLYLAVQDLVRDVYQLNEFANLAFFSLEKLFLVTGDYALDFQLDVLEPGLFIFILEHYLEDILQEKFWSLLHQVSQTENLID
jgi:hypothetical protein